VGTTAIQAKWGQDRQENETLGRAKMRKKMRNLGKNKKRNLGNKRAI
jgi:hypothetical protein